MRRRFAWLAGATVLLGLAVLAYRGPYQGLIRGGAGDVCATAFIAFVLGALAPRVAGIWRWTVAFAISAAVELVQLLELPFAATRLGKLTLGAHFDPLDFVWYALGAVLAAGCERWLAVTARRDMDADRRARSCAL